MKYELTDEELILALRALQEDIAERDEIIKQQKTVIEKMRDALKIYATGEIQLENGALTNLESFNGYLKIFGVQHGISNFTKLAIQTLKEINE